MRGSYQKRFAKPPISSLCRARRCDRSTENTLAAAREALQLSDQQIEPIRNEAEDVLGEVS